MKDEQIIIEREIDQITELVKKNPRAVAYMLCECDYSYPHRTNRSKVKEIEFEIEQMSSFHWQDCE